MRVIAGCASGHVIKAPDIPPHPATDLIHGAIFFILENMTSDWLPVLDLVSGFEK